MILLWWLTSDGMAPSLVRRGVGLERSSSRNAEPEVPKTGKCLEGTWRFMSEGQEKRSSELQ